MRRLRDEDRSDPAIDEAVRLLETEGPLAPSAEREQRVLAALRRRDERPGAGRRLLRPALVIVILGCVATAGGAAATRAYVLRLRYRAERAAKVAPPVPSQPTIPRSHPAPATQATLPMPVVSTAGVPPIPTGTPVPSVTRHAVAGPAASVPATTGPVLPPAPESVTAEPPEKPLRHAFGPDAELVVDAIKALRREHDTARAAALLGRYRTLHPNGVLAEDALALSIEAATRQGEPRIAVALAAQYLSRYPHGRFAETARRARATASASQPMEEDRGTGAHSKANKERAP